MTAQTWIDATRDILLTDYIEEQATLAGSLTAVASDTDVSFTLPAAVVPGVVAGATLEVGSEFMYVYSVTEAGLATVQRAFRGSDLAAHSIGDVVTVNPKFPTYRIIEELNNELLSMSSPQNGLYQMATVEITFNSSQDGYDLTAVTDDVDAVYQVTWSDSGPETAEPRLPRWKLRRNRNTSDFPSGLALIVYDDAESGRTMLIEYKTDFTQLTDETTALSTVGLHTQAYDIPQLGAAMRLMSSRPIRREFLDEQGFSRRSEEVPAGAPAASMQTLRALKDTRMNEEATRLAQRYPDNWQRAGAGVNSGVGRF